MELSAADIELVPAENLRVSRAEFAAVWVEAERYQDEQTRRGVTDWYNTGVIMTCRWLARATVRPESGAWRLARSPVTEREGKATPELIEAEYLAAAKLAMRQPPPSWLLSRPGWIEAVEATLNWAWRRAGDPPADTEHSATG